jgi:predicted small lipoprotein YifL
MKNKILVLVALAALFTVGACDTKKPSEAKEGSKSDSTVVKADSTVAKTPKDSTATVK